MIATLLDSALLLTLIGLVWLVIRTRVAPQVGYALFLLVPLKLLVPVAVTVPAGLAQWTPSALASSWFKGTHGAEVVEGHPSAESPAVALATGQADSSGSRLEPFLGSRPLTAETNPQILPGEVESKFTSTAAMGGPAQPGAGAARLSVSALVMIAWLAGVLLLLGRLAHAQLRFRAQLRRVSPLDESRLAIDLPRLCRLAGVPETIRLVEHDSIAAPAVWGVVRPAIIFPQGLAFSLSARQLRWVLLHELAHVRRLDLIVVALQRCVAILHFFNPAAWIANRIIHRLREYACDDLAASLSPGTAVESGEAFLRILRHADRSGRNLEGALGVFGLDSRASCFLRIQRLLDAERPIRPAPGAWSLWALILLAVIAVPQLRASGDDLRADSQDRGKGSAALEQPDPKAGGDKAVAKAEPSFELRVVGPDRKPVPEAVVEIRTKPAPSAEQIRRGTFVKKSTYGPIVKTDAEGCLVVVLPQAPDHFDVNITTPGYGPYWAGWSSESHEELIPSRFTAELEAGWSVGGVIVDAAGKPVEGVKIHPNLEFKKRPGDHRQFGVGTTLKTDVAGKWHFDSVPALMGEVFVEIDHPDYKSLRRPLTRDEFGIERGREPVSKVVLDRGLTVTGRVTDEAGKPIVGARIRTKFLNDIREAKTGDDGVYKLAGCEPRSARIVASAKGRATDVKELSIDQAMGPVDFQMKPGGTVRIRVLDAQGNPVPKARILFQQWRGHYAYFEFDHVSQYADKEGVWVWNEAPLDEFQADICSDHEMDLVDQPLTARAEEYVFRLPPPLVVTGKVIDAVTKEPIKAFRVVPGVRSSESHMNWIPSQTYSASDGHLRFRRDRGDFAHMFRIEADGYMPTVSRDFKSNEGNVSIDFELKRGKDIIAKVVTPGILPAIGAKVALGVAGSQINIQNGDIDDASTYCTRETTDKDGRFHFPPQDKDFQLVITHTSGYAHIKSAAEWATVRIIRLKPWSRVEGTFRVGKTPTANVPITISSGEIHSYGPDAPSIFTHHDVTTGPGGRFVFDRVVSGRGAIGRRIMLTVDDGATDVTSSCMLSAEFPGGKTAHIDLGGTGRPVVGKLRPPDGFDEKVRWNFALVTAQPDAAEAGVAGPYLTASVDRDGHFRIDDVPVGTYSLSVRFDRNGAGQLLNHRIEVPAQAGDVAVQAVDLGVLKLEKR
ncbi:M56 family metallopeptidase [Singulisphaera sp. GP187]|uniref:M56 family metallopeptidase n=1 Tax=Singulisphaera sp. GP187 TaxID=1882752 RepID=UPI00135644F8|nr:M56 family metallopeptidase [Singulisphaera sp. GP187]